MSILQMPSENARLVRKGKKKESGHRMRVMAAAIAAVLLVLSLAVYGSNYYILPIDQRPFSPKYELLRPSGSIGLKLGIFGTALFFVIFLYAFRKVIPWLGRLGTARHWMDFHVVAGLTAPIVIAFHASFKFRGIAGMAFWIMVAVALSGVIGRYLYAQIPRSRNAAEMTLTELKASESEFSEALLAQSVFSAGQLARSLHIPGSEHARDVGMLHAFGVMVAVDITMLFRIASLRRIHSGVGTWIRSFGGLLPTGNREVEQVVRLVRQKASLSKRVLFLSQAQRVFHLWHVIHRPFSYAFAVLALLHIAVVMGLGFAMMGSR